MGAIVNLLTDVVLRRERRSGTYSPAKWFVDWATGGEESSSGVSVNCQSAMKYTPFWACVRVISGTVASLPFIVYRRLDSGGKMRQQDHKVYELLHDRPNEYMDAVTFIETRQAHVLTYGNGYAEIQRDGAGRPVALWPLMPQPDRTKRMVSDDGVLYYQVRSPTGETFNLPDYNVLHIKGLGFDGYTGYDVVQYQKEAIGYGIAVKQFGARFFSNGANLGGVFEHPLVLSDQSKKNLLKSVELEYSGLKKAHRMMILEEGMKFNKTGVEPEKAQALEIQKWTVDDCARIFYIPPHKIGSMEHSKYNNIEQENIDFVIRMLYWFRKWEQECNYKMFMPSERKSLFCEILVEGLLRGDILTRTQALAMQKDRGVLSRNEWRELENRNPVEGGDELTETSNPIGNRSWPDINENVKKAHRELLASQWSRIITKLINAKGNGDFIEDQKNHANTILREPVETWAALNNVSNDSARTILKEIIEQNIKKDRIFERIDSEKLADLTMSRIGGNYERWQHRNETISQ